jgi:hypothetical protein
MSIAMRNACLVGIIAGTLLTGCRTPQHSPWRNELATVTARTYTPARVDPLFLIDMVLPWVSPEQYLITLATPDCTSALRSQELYHTTRIGDTVPVRTRQLTREHLVLSRYGIIDRYTLDAGCELTLR